jgi:hypothetical protein
VENPQNTPATRPVPSTPSTVSTKYGPSIMSLSRPSSRSLPGAVPHHK